MDVKHAGPLSIPMAAFFVLSILGCVGNSPTQTAFVDIGINSVMIELTDVETGDTSTYEWRVISENDGTELTADTLKFTDGIALNGSVSFFDTLGADVTEQIKSSPEDFQVFFGFFGSVDQIQFEITDRESDYVGGNRSGDNLKVGLAFQITIHVDERERGLLRVSLNRYDARSKDGVQEGDELLIQSDFPLLVEFVEEEDEGDGGLN